jgi:hypothetical protein
MKKIVLVALLILASISASAQVYVGGEIGLWVNNHNSAKSTVFSVAPEVGYNFNKKWAMGAALEYSYEKEGGISANAFAIAPYARYSYYEKGMVRLFVDGGFGVSNVSYKNGGDVTGGQVGFQPGIALELNHHFSLVAKCGFLGWRQDYALAGDGVGFMLGSEDLSFGFHYEF